MKNRSMLQSINRASLVTMPKRFDGQYIHYKANGNTRDMLPVENGKMAADNLDDSEVVTRIMYVMNNFGIFDLSSFSFNNSFESQGVDSLEVIALITSVEHEFHTVFEDHVFDSFENLEQIKR